MLSRLILFLRLVCCQTETKSPDPSSFISPEFLFVWVCVCVGGGGVRPSLSLSLSLCRLPVSLSRFACFVTAYHKNITKIWQRQFKILSAFKKHLANECFRPIWKAHFAFSVICLNYLFRNYTCECPSPHPFFFFFFFLTCKYRAQQQKLHIVLPYQIKKRLVSTRVFSSPQFL